MRPSTRHRLQRRVFSKGRSTGVKICKTFALLLTRCIATVDAGFMQFYYYILRSGFYVSLSNWRTFRNSIRCLSLA